VMAVTVKVTEGYGLLCSSETFQTNTLPASLGLKSKPNKKPT
jgi:hypothetical protein